MSDDDKNEGKPSKVTALKPFRDRAIADRKMQEMKNSADAGDLRNQLAYADYLVEQVNADLAFRYYSRATEFSDIDQNRELKTHAYAGLGALCYFTGAKDPAQAQGHYERALKFLKFPVKE